MSRELGSRAGQSFFTHVHDDDSPDTAPAASRLARFRRAATGRTKSRAVAGVTVAAMLAGIVALLLPTSALADPTANQWLRLRICESSDNYSINTGNGHYGAYQFDLSTWQSVGGSGLPSNASPAEQDARALTLFHERGWQPWQCAEILGFTGGGSGSAPAPVVVSQPMPAGVPAYPGRSFSPGDSSPSLAVWQREMRLRGAALLTGTGLYGPNTALVVKALQQQNGLAPEGLLGPQTWALAWKGTFVPSAATHGGPITVPAFAGPNLAAGVWNARVALIQKQLRARGATTVTGTGEFGPRTTALIKSLQQQNHRPVTGVIDATTWRLAWAGSFHV